MINPRGGQKRTERVRQYLTTDSVSAGKLESEIASLEELLVQKKVELDRLKNELLKSEINIPQSKTIIAGDVPYRDINKLSTPKDKISLFRSLFRGRGR
jgi:hypothetical protein